ncbi:MAG TPA: hypothetical protein VNT75_32015 [Symbiobacteriaceae bacterium]|nr:hypothetical protein [Symbiobacteriaceae bacterium]
MIWVLGFAGIALALIGLWGGPAKTTKRREAEAMARKQPTVSDAWEVLSKPLEEELIKIPEHRPWYAPGGDRRFQQGLLVGLGAGLMVAAVSVSFLPREAAPKTDLASNKPAPAPVQTAPTQPAGQAPAAAPTQQPAAPAPTPVNINITVDDGDAASTIADKLKARGLIANTDQFLARVTELGADTSLKAGTFSIPTGAPLDAVIKALTS